MQIRLLEVIEATTGGTRRHLRYLLSHLDLTRFSVTLLYSNDRDSFFEDDLQVFRALGIRLIEVPMRRAISPLHDFAAFLRIVWVLTRESFDVVHLHSSKAGFLGRLAAHLVGGVAVLYSPHSFAFQYSPSSISGGFFLFLERLVSGLHDALLCVSRGEQEAALKYGLATDLQMRILENAIPEPFEETDGRFIRAELGIAADALVVGTVAQLRPQKGLRHLLAAIPLVLNRFPDTHFVLVGSGPLLSDLSGRIRDLGIERNVFMVGHQENVWRFYRAMDIYVSASLWEGMPYAVIEAMAVGLPIVATDVVGNNELVLHGKHGYLVPAEQPAALAQSICRLLANQDLRIAFGRASKAAYDSHLGLREWIRQYEEFYSEVSAQETKKPTLIGRVARRLFSVSRTQLSEQQ